MTVLVGVRCTDGVVIGCDSIATSSMGQFPLIHLPFDGKIKVFPGNVIVARTGSIGYAQRLHEHIEAAIKGAVFTNFAARECTNNISNRFITDLVGSMAPTGGPNGIGFGALIATHLKDGPLLAEFGTHDFQPEVKTEKLFFVSMGSGQVLADPFLLNQSRAWAVSMSSPHRPLAFIGDENAGCAPAPISPGKESAMERSRPTLHLFENRIANEKAKLERLASELKPGPERDNILRKISQLETAARFNEWVSSPSLKVPRRWGK